MNNVLFIVRNWKDNKNQLVAMPILDKTISEQWQKKDVVVTARTT